MQERVNEKTVAIAVQATKMTGRLLARIGEMYLRHVREKQRDHKMAKSRDTSTFKQNQAGKVKIKTLMGEGDGVSNVEIRDKNIRTKVLDQLDKKPNSTTSDILKVLCDCLGIGDPIELVDDEDENVINIGNLRAIG